jgi:hypothetical protein
MKNQMILIKNIAPSRRRIDPGTAAPSFHSDMSEKVPLIQMDKGQQMTAWRILLT